MISLLQIIASSSWFCTVPHENPDEFNNEYNGGDDKNYDDG